MAKLKCHESQLKTALGTIAAKDGKMKAQRAVLTEKEVLHSAEVQQEKLRADAISKENKDISKKSLDCRRELNVTINKKEKSDQECQRLKLKKESLKCENSDLKKQIASLQKKLQVLKRN